MAVVAESPQDLKEVMDTDAAPGLGFSTSVVSAVRE